jgi:hypothetical protein
MTVHRDDESRHGTPGSVEFYRWQGHIDETLNQHTRRLDTINGDIRDIKHSMENLERSMSRDMSEMKVNFSSDMATLKAKVAMFSAIGGLVGAGVVSLVFGVITR